MSKAGIFITGVLAGILVIVLFTLRQPNVPASSRMPQAIGSSISSSISNVAHVVRAVDGDTLVVIVSDMQVYVRVLGIDAPESVDPKRSIECYGQEASKRMHDIADGKDVTLTMGDEDRDAYGRLLRFIEIDGKDIGAEMLRGGFAENFCASFPHPRCEEYDRLQEAASVAKIGLWNACK